MNITVDKYLLDGCGRCKYFTTPQCKVNTWREELILLRSIIMECGLTEEVKWSFPTYTHNKKNIFILSAFKEFTSINFFKGALIEDTKNILVKAGENTQQARLLKFTNTKDIIKNKTNIKAYIKQAIEIEKKGLKLPASSIKPIAIPGELETAFKKMPPLQKAFYALTPGKQKGYLIHFNGAKQSETRISRIEKCTEKILAGRPFLER